MAADIAKCQEVEAITVLFWGADSLLLVLKTEPGVVASATSTSGALGIGSGKCQPGLSGLPSSEEF